MNLTMNHSKAPCEMWRELCKTVPVSGGLRHFTSKQYHHLLSLLDEYEHERDLQRLMQHMGDEWPFPTHGPKHNIKSEAFKREIDEDIAAVFSRLNYKNESSRKDHLNTESLNVILLYNLLARRGIETNVNTLKLHYAMHCLAPDFIRDFSIRWFISYCDSIADSSIFNDDYRAKAVAASTTLNSLKIYASVFKTAAAGDLNLEDYLVSHDKARLPLGHGMITYWYQGGDVIANYLDRTLQFLGDEDLISLYFRKSIYAFIFENPDNEHVKNILTKSNNPLHESKMAMIVERCKHAVAHLEMHVNEIEFIQPNPFSEKKTAAKKASALSRLGWLLPNIQVVKK
jgi:hypothetical protein